MSRYWAVMGSNHLIYAVLGGLLGMLGSLAFAAPETLGDISYRLTQSFAGLAQLIHAIAYIMGLAFFVGAVMKFKQHKDNPTQVPIGTPIALMFVAASLVFMHTILEVLGASMFIDGGQMGGSTGVIFTASNYATPPPVTTQ